MTSKKNSSQYQAHAILFVVALFSGLAGVAIGLKLADKPLSEEVTKDHEIQDVLPPVPVPLKVVDLTSPGTLTEEDSAKAELAGKRQVWESNFGNLLGQRMADMRGYPELYAQLHQLHSNQPDAVIADLQRFLLLPVEAFGEMDQLERLALWNEALNALFRQKSADNGTADFVAGLVLNPDLDPGLRNYALQFVFALEEMQVTGPRVSDPLYAKVRLSAYSDPKSSLAGVAMLADLRHVRRLGLKEAEAVGLLDELRNYAADILRAAGRNLATGNATTALGVLIDLDDPEVDSWMVQILSDPSAYSLGLRLVAIRGAGGRQLQSLTPRLLELASNEDEHDLIKEAAIAALKKMDDNAAPHGEKNDV